MKRCPQCEFLYEDDQGLCDMDGALLVFDSRKLPNLHALATVPAVPVQQRRSRAVPAFATLVLAVVLGMVYYVSTQRHTSSPALPASNSSNAVPVSNPAPVAEPSAEASESPKEAEPQPAAKRPPVKKPAAKTVGAPQAIKPTAEPKKEDSKVGSILKKTGHILKKPFKF
jgi:hypothetical protein